MADTLKFGPQWLRALSDGGTVTSPPPSPGLVAKYKLAEFRYGREEMLALHTSDTKMPDIMREFPPIAAEKCLVPLAYIPPTDDEQRLMAQGVNSTAVLRLFGRGGGPSVRGGMGRGGGIERGRGRGRGRGEGAFYTRGVSYDEEGFGRGRPGRGGAPDWEEGDGRRLERSFSGRPSFEDTATSPRREFSRSMSSDNWREAKKGGGGNEGEEEGGDGDWRRAGPRDKWSRASWREAKDHHDHYEQHGGHHYHQHRGERVYQRSRSTGSHDDDPELPEWSMADIDDMENNFIGTFDSSGAFVSIKDGRDDPRLRDGAKLKMERGRRNSDEQGNNEIKSKQNSHHHQNEAETENWDEETEEEPPEMMKPRVMPGKNNNERSNNVQGGQGQQGVPQGGPQGGIVAAQRKTKSLEKPLKSNERMQVQGGGVNNAGPERFSGPSRSAEGVRKEMGHRQVVNEKMSSKESSPGSNNTLSTSDINMNRKNIRQDEGQPRNSPRSPEVDNRAQGTPSPHGNVVEQQQQTQQQHPNAPPHLQQQQHRPPMPQEADFGHLEKAAEDLVEQFEAEEDSRLNNKLKVEQLKTEHADKWFYKDPQGDHQGPFSSQDMTEWFTAGYFTMNLLVRRGCDEVFNPLGELIKRWGRVPFIPGVQPPPLTASQSDSPVATSVMSSATNIPIQSPMTTVPMTTVPASLPNLPNLPGLPTMPNIPNLTPEQLKQQLLLQQHLYLQQMQLQQQMNPQQQHMLLSLLVQQQQQQFSSLFKAQGAPSPPPQHMPRPASGEGAPTSQAAFQNPLNDPAIQSYQRSLSQPTTMEQQWPPNTSPHAVPGWPGASTVPPTTVGPSVWDMEPAKNNSSPSMEDMQRAEAEKQAREVAGREAAAAREREAQAREIEAQVQREREAQMNREREAQMNREREVQMNREREAQMNREREVQMNREREAQAQREREAALREAQERERQKEAEERARREEEHRRRVEEEEEKRRKAEEEERRRQAEMERQRMEQLRREQEELRRRQMEEEKRQREEEERKRREEEQRKRREEEERRRVEEEERLRREQEEIENKRLEEISRRQKAEELRRHQEAARRIQQEQLQNIQLPSTAQWGSGSGGNSTSSAPSLEEIQRIEAEQLKEQQEEQLRLEMQRQQMAALQRQQQQQTTWAAQARSAAQPSPMSLRKIQQEQALQLESNRQRAPQPKPASVPLATAAAWGSGGAPSGGNWAADSAWGRPAPSAAGFWDDPAPAPAPAPKQQSKKQQKAQPNASFPTLNTSKKNKPETNTNKTKAAKNKKEEETVQRLFQMKPKDDFTQWCEQALCDIESSVDVPTFIAFLQDVESPYEVHDYVRNYLGDTRDSEIFATSFLERRSKFKNQIKKEQKPEESIWGPAPAVNPILKQQQQQQQLQLQQQAREDEEAAQRKKSKKKMQKVDNKFLGFTVLAAPDRINIGEIDSIE